MDVLRTDHLRICGGRSLAGEIAASGSKNAALPIMAASILAGGPVALADVPRLRDVDTLAAVLQQLGIEAHRQPDGQLTLETTDEKPLIARRRLVSRMRASFCVLGPLVARRRKAIVALPGGCRIGDRPIDLHLKGLAALGADIFVERGYVIARARRLQGATIDLAGPRGSTVTGTANVMTAAVLARGTTILRGAATEPEIVDLGDFLNTLGARIAGLGTSTIEIRGVAELGGGSHRVIPDRIEAGTLLAATAIAGGQTTIRHVRPDHLTAVLERLAAIGCRLDVGADFVSIGSSGSLRAADLVALPYPGIPTDLQAQFLALACLAAGRSTIRDCVFPERFHHVAQLRRMGARITQRGDCAVVSGVSQMRGATVVASDLRASAALVLAGLAAHGETVVQRISHLDRGYERLDEKLNSLGARIVRISYEKSAPQAGRLNGRRSAHVSA